MHRYSLAFTEYGVSMLTELTPAYRARHIEALDGMIQKMLDPIVWDYWMRGDELGFDWGGDNPIHLYNIMYTGHLQLMMAFYERQAGDRKYIDSDVALTTEVSYLFYPGSDLDELDHISIKARLVLRFYWLE